MQMGGTSSGVRYTPFLLMKNHTPCSTALRVEMRTIMVELSRLPDTPPASSKKWTC